MICPNRAKKMQNRSASVESRWCRNTSPTPAYSIPVKRGPYGAARPGLPISVSLSTLGTSKKQAAEDSRGGLRGGRSPAIFCLCCQCLEMITYGIMFLENTAGKMAHKICRKKKPHKKFLQQKSRLAGGFSYNNRSRGTICRPGLSGSQCRCFSP